MTDTKSNLSSTMLAEIMNGNTYYVESIGKHVWRYTVGYTMDNEKYSLSVEKDGVVVDSTTYSKGYEFFFINHMEFIAPFENWEIL